ncbi:hypothetical protein [Parvibacter caecicola]|nr:hypothetical protein [Parvibacter caecicola]
MGNFTSLNWAMPSTMGTFLERYGVPSNRGPQWSSVATVPSSATSML